MTIIGKLRDLHKQATVERSHYYVGSVCVEAADRIATLEMALNSLLPGLVLDRRYADADDDIAALNSRIETVQEALYPTAPNPEVKP